jgi:uncharacterized protein (TIGR02145 family)
MKKKLLLMMLCLPMLLAAQQTNGVKVSGLAVDAGTVTFNVNWTDTDIPTLWSDTVWVFVDYNNNGVMERLPLSVGATLTATSPGGEVIEETDNNQGVWIAGNARTNSSFSATVQLLTATANLAGVCAYASNYPPVGKYISASEITFTGTPEYKVVLERINKSTYTATVGKNESLSIPTGEAALSFTDKTGAPGKLGCIPMTGNIGFTVPAIISKGLAASFEAITSNLTAPAVAALIYTWAAPEFSPDTHSGATYTPIAPVTPGTYSVTLTVSSEGYCDLVASKDVEVIDCIPSTVYDLEVSALGFCEGDAGVTFALSWTDAENSYQLYRDDTAVGAPLEGKGSPATFSGFFEAGTYTAWTVPGGAFCPAEMSGIHIITVITATSPNSTVNFTAFNPCSGAPTGTVWYLTDTRETNNNQTYKVKKMADGHIWMVQDLKFGDKCDKTSFSGSNGKDQTGNVTSLKDKVYFGDCRNNPQSGAGYLYDWAAAVNHSQSFYTGSYGGCTGTASGTSNAAPAACQGICPDNWHLQTYAEFLDSNTAIYNAFGGWLATGFGIDKPWERVPGVMCDPAGNIISNDATWFWSSSQHGPNYGAAGVMTVTGISAGSYVQRHYGVIAQCVLNY